MTFADRSGLSAQQASPQKQKKPMCGHGVQRAGPGDAPWPFGLNELGFSRPCRPGSHVVAAWAGRFGWVAMIGTVLWSVVRYACADDGVTIA